MLDRWNRHALDWLCPQACVLCNVAGQMLCAACERDARIDPSAACVRCAIPLPPYVQMKLCGRCLRRPPAFDRTIAAALYDAPFDQLVRGLKYGATLAYAPLFARLLHSRIADAVLPDVDVVLPVPLSRARMATRGFNQAIEIARPLALRLGKPLDIESVLRITDTAPQASLPFDARRRNVRGAFAVIDARRERIIGRRIGVVDDVMTTGATLEELAKTLKRVGAVAVVNLVVARTP
jgi:ComF family protein